MNRQNILASVRRQLRESLAETGEVRPLVEIVGRVATEIRGETAAQPTASPVIPIETVAAFVDGYLDAAEEKQICDAVMFDNSVLAELIASVRAAATASEDLPELPDSLAARLNKMAPRTLAIEPATEPVGTTESSSDDSVETSTDPTVVIVSPSSHQPVNDTSNRRVLPILALVIAASLAIAAFVYSRSGPESPRPISPERSIVEQQPTESTNPLVTPEPSLDDERKIDNRAIVDHSPQDSDPDSQEDQIEQSPPPMQAPETAIVGDPKSLPPNRTASNESPLPESAPPILMEEPEKRVELTWKEVTGLLAIREDAPSNAVESRSNPTWRPIQQGATFQSSSVAAKDQRVLLRTLPFSRADGEFSGGGRLVLAGDSAIVVNRDAKDVAAVIDVSYGSIAMMGFKEGMEVQLRQDGKQLASLRWQGTATAVIHRRTDGLQIQVDRGRVEINEQIVSSKSIHVATDQSIKSVRAPKRIPKWVTETTNPDSQFKTVLAQIASSDDLSKSLNRTISALSASGRDQSTIMTQLANMQVSMSGANIFRMVSSRIPAVRLAALQRLAMMPETDPRYQRTWSSMERAINNPQRYRQIRSWFELVRVQRRPTTDQLEVVMAGLSNRDYAGRAVSDFILRQYVTNPPPFDPAWTGPTLQRAINAYRIRAGLPARPNAANARP
ncbi:MAG: hypothetical protein AB8B91_04105 [Rubripirellula sp.]